MTLTVVKDSDSVAREGLELMGVEIIDDEENELERRRRSGE